MRKSLGNIVSEIQEKERKLSLTCSGLIEEAFQMTVYLQELLVSSKECVLNSGFVNEAKEIEFFKMVKPQILGKLIYYNKLYRIETACPVNNGKMYHTYFANHLQELKIEFREHICNSHFYRYYIFLPLDFAGVSGFSCCSCCCLFFGLCCPDFKGSWTFLVASLVLPSELTAVCVLWASVGFTLSLY